MATPPLNMTMDLNRGITSISYDINQRPRSVVFDSGASTSYLYSADGVKLQTRHRTPTLSPAAGMGVADENTEESVTDYCGLFIYEDGELTRINLENGYLSYRSYSGQKLEVPEYVFYLRDHLGNNRVTMSANGGIYQIDHFYPFCLPMGCSYNSSHQQWRFGGKELDRTAGLDLYDFEARAYDPSTARFTRPDDLSEKYHPISPMVFCANNPLILIDPTGEDIVVLNYTEGEHLAMLIQNEDGKWQYYSVNGNNLYIPFTDCHFGGRKFNDVAVGEWDSPMEFFNSPYNVENENSKDDPTMNHYGFSEGYLIEANPEQDEIMRESFTKTANSEYNLWSNNCATAVQKAMIDAGIPVSKPTMEPSTIPMSTPFGVIDVYNGEKMKCEISKVPSIAFKSIIEWNPGGKYLHK